MDAGSFIEFSVQTPDLTKFKWLWTNLAIFGMFACIFMIALIFSFKVETDKITEAFLRRYNSIETHG